MVRRVALKSKENSVVLGADPTTIVTSYDPQTGHEDSSPYFSGLTRHALIPSSNTNRTNDSPVRKEISAGSKSTATSFFSFLFSLFFSYFFFFPNFHSRRTAK